MPKEVKIRVFPNKAGKLVMFNKGGKSYSLNVKPDATHEEIEAAVKKELSAGEKKNG